MDDLSLIKASLTPFTDLGLKLGKNLCPIHQENTPSCELFEADGIYLFKCFGCGASGSIVDMYAHKYDVEDAQACRELVDRYGGSDIERTAAWRDPIDIARPEPTKVRPKAFEKNAERPHRITNKKGDTKSYIWAAETETTHMYVDADMWDYTWGEVDGVEYCWGVARWDNVEFKNGSRGKLIRPAFFDGENWLTHFSKDSEIFRPLYGASTFEDDDEIWVVEGEKDRRAFDSMVAHGMIFREKVPMNVKVTTWIGGSKAMLMTDFAPLYGKHVVLWLDNDEAGRSAQGILARMLSRNGAHVEIVEPFEPVAKGEEGWG